MLIIPAVDIRAGSCVRLVHGDPNQETIYSADPVEMAKRWAAKGATRIHVIDLDGAFTGHIHHLELAAKMKWETGCEIQFGGGLREKEIVRKALRMGIDKLILGTAALEEMDWVKSALDWHADRLIVAIDSHDNQVAKEGWKEDVPLTVENALKKMEQLGFCEAIYTDIERDGTLEGPNLTSVKNVVSKTRMGIYASGGISSIEDIKKLKEIPGLKGTIIGKGLYAGNISLEDALRL